MPDDKKTIETTDAAAGTSTGAEKPAADATAGTSTGAEKPAADATAPGTPVVNTGAAESAAAPDVGNCQTKE